MNADVIARSIQEWVNIDLSKSNQIKPKNIDATTLSVNESVSYGTTTAPNKQQYPTRIETTAMSTHRFVNINQIHSSTTIESSKTILIPPNESFEYTTIPDEVFCQMLLKAFNGNTEKIDYFLKENEKIELIRHYTNLIDQFSYIKLQQSQWNWYYLLGITKHIWTDCIPKHVAERDSICHTYGRSKHTIEQHCKQINAQLPDIENTIQAFQQEVELKSSSHIRMKTTSTNKRKIIHQRGNQSIRIFIPSNKRTSWSVK